MHVTLLTFLGKGRDSAKTGYRVADYLFPDGVERRSAFFGLALAAAVEPDLVVMLGTAGSMWGVLVEHLAADGEQEDLRVELMDAELHGAVDQALLDRVAPLLERAVGRAVLPKLIPNGRGAAEQVAMLSVIAASVPNNTQAHIDVTHGFRHLGMVGFLSAELLQRLRLSMQVCSLWYGALDMTQQGRTPVLSLDGLQAVQQWVSALDRFDASNDYGVFAPLLELDGLSHDKAQRLVEAAFFESASNVSDAARRINTLLSELDAPLQGASELFRQTLRSHLEWARLHDLAAQQHLLAQRALVRGDFLRAVILGLESFVTRLCQQQDMNPLDYADREEADAAFRQRFKAGEVADTLQQDYWNLKNLRNAMAHGTPPNIAFVQKLLRNQQRLRDVLQDTLQRLGKALP
jgi:CRISPR-associated Csx2 family protein